MLTSRIELFDKLVSDINKYSPIVIQGEAGVGKSFLARALCQRLKENGIIKEYTIRNSWDLVNGMICALCDKNMGSWRQEIVTSDIIVIEDFHFLKNKTATLEELYQIAQSTKAPIIITTSEPIESSYCDDLIAFLNAGAHIQLAQPTQAEIAEFLNFEIKANGIQLSTDANKWLMENINSLTIAKGAIKTLCLYRENTDECITLEDCQRIVQPLLSQCGKEFL